MKIYLHEIKEQDKEIDVTEAEPWVANTLAAVDEDPEDISSLRPARAKAAPRPARVHFNLRKVDDVIVVSGDMDTSVNLLCSRCAKEFQLPVDEHFTALYCKDKEMAGISYLDRHGNPRGQNKSYARHAHADESETDGATEAATDLEITYIPEEYLDLADVLLEQLQLRVPFQPLCREDCKGICANCGADWNLGRCACSKILSKNPFSVLKNFKT